jgi:subtilisin family serine protease
MNPMSSRRAVVRATWALALSALMAGTAQPALAQSKKLSELAVYPQIEALMLEKANRTAAQKKLSPHLLYAARATRGLRTAGTDAVAASALEQAAPDFANRVSVDLKGRVDDVLVAEVLRLGGTVSYASVRQGAMRAMLPLGAVEALAAHPQVAQIQPAERFTTNIGSVMSQGYISHKAKEAVLSGYNGSGVRVGVLSDSASAARVAALIASGDLPADTVVLPGKEGTGNDEGTAMMEIVSDVAPGAKLFFATANGGQAAFADAIRSLRNDYNCDVIVDDVSYFLEAAFQDGTVSKAVNDVTASGALYFSSAANSGNVTSGTSGTWEGDFVDGGAVGGVLGTAGETGQVHAFAAGQGFNTLTAAATTITLKWADPLGGSSNDYDLFVLNATGTSILCVAAGSQTGTQDPSEICQRSAGYPVGSRIVVVKFSGDDRALRLDTHRGRLAINTVGSTFGHNAGANTVSTAAVYWNSAKTGTKPFVGGAANPTETFSSDGPRRIFFNPDGTPITPGNLLFATNGGTTLAKPDIAAADGVSTKTPGFSPFYGTSAAAPHAAGVAALVKSARPDYSNAQILTAMKATALDIRAVGVDRDAGSGIVMGYEAVQWSLTH